MCRRRCPRWRRHDAVSFVVSVALVVDNFAVAVANALQDFSIAHASIVVFALVLVLA